VRQAPQFGQWAIPQASTATQRQDQACEPGPRVAVDPLKIDGRDLTASWAPLAEIGNQRAIR